MTKQQQENLDELWSDLMELAGDIIAIQNFFACKADCMDSFGPEVCETYLRRTGDYTDQHIKEIQQLKDVLLITELRQISSY